MTTWQPIQPDSITPEGRIVRQVEPRNDEFDFGRLVGLITPNDLFYIRSHGPVPEIDPAGYRLEVTGLVERPLSLSLLDLQAMAQLEEAGTLECAGNRRTFQDPVPGGVPWKDGAVSTAVWRGVSLAAVLRQAGVKSEGKHVLLEGAETCNTDSGPTRFARSVPVEAAMAEDALLTLSMNGEPIPKEHGAPVRAMLPSTYAMNSIKWLTRINVQQQEHDGHFQTKDYRMWYSDDDPGKDIGAVRVVATIAQPRPETSVNAGRVTVRGAAWTGTGTVERVEVSTDGGRTWQPARLTSDATPKVWRLWEYDWDATPGGATLMARATDTVGNTQPDALPPNRKGYANNFPLPVPVRVQG